MVATLAALAYAKPHRIKNMISTRGASVTAHVQDTSEISPTSKEVKEETVLYKVRFAEGDPVEVSGLLWTRDGKLVYALSTEGALWPSIIEKAYVFGHGGNSYETVSNSVTPHEAMRNILGSVIELRLKEKPRNLTSVLKRANSRPTVADTWKAFVPPNTPTGFKVPGILENHTYAVLGFENGKVSVFDVLDGAVIDVALNTFKQAFESVNQAQLP